MGLLDRFRPGNRRDAEKTATATNYQTITEYAPAFSTWNGRVYEDALIRASIEKTAVLASKLKPEVTGDAAPRVKRAVDTAPNQYMSWPTLLRRAMTLYLTDNTCAIVPSLDSSLNVTGLFPLKFEHAEIVDYAHEPWIRFYVAGQSEPLAIELRNVCLLTRFQYDSDFFGSTNAALRPTMDLIGYQNQAQKVAIENGAKIQYIAQAASSMRPEDIEKKRNEFSEVNLGEKNKSGLLVYDNTFDRLVQVEPQSYVIDSDEMDRIQSNVFNYFGMNQNILQSDYTGDQFAAFYESVLEPFAVQLGEGLSQLLFTVTQRRHGNAIMFSANRLEYASNAEKRNMIRDMLDRRVMTINEAREILQLKPVPGGDVFVERGEYVTFDIEGNVIAQTGGVVPGMDGIIEQQGPTYGEEDRDLGGDDQEYVLNDTRGTSEVDR